MAVRCRRPWISSGPAMVALLGLLLVATSNAVLAQGGPTLPLEPVEDPLYGIRSVVPESWTHLGQGLHARGTPPDDPTLIAIQSAPVSMDALWPSLLPQLGLADVPEPTGSRQANGFDWTLYALEVALPAVTLSVELATAERAGTTYLVLLQAPGTEFAPLREAVFLPAVDALEPLAPQPTPDPQTLPYGVEEVTFPGGEAGITLAGTLTLPTGPGPHPVVVLLSGSGAQDRDESLRPLSLLRPFALVADALTRAGVAVLRYDDRGVGGSSGDYDSATVADLTADARAALDFAAEHPDLDAGRIGLLGHSEGGIYAATLATEDPRVAFVVGMAAPAVDGVSLLTAQYEAIARSGGGTEDDIRAQLAFAQDALPAARDGDLAALEAAIREHVGADWDRQPPEVRAIYGEREEHIERQLRAQLPLMSSEWFGSLLASDPGRDWRRVQVPVLGLFGALDTQVVTAQNEPALREALAVAGNEEGETVVLPDANHLFQAAVTGSPAEYPSLEAALTPDFLPLLTAWVVEQVGEAG